MIELDSLKNICSVNYFPNCLLWPVQANIVRNIDVNGNESETLGACTGQRRHFGEEFTEQKLFRGSSSIT